MQKSDSEAGDASTPPDLPETVAAVDLGSNSFHLLVARIDHGELKVVDRLREMVRLAAGLDGNRRLSGPAMERALACLGRFGQLLRSMPSGSVRAVGTNTLRSTRNPQEFLTQAEEALGHPIEVIAGIEEARLIYQGVAHSLANDGVRRLVIDIGGGSTELIVGERLETIHMESLYMGCVTMTQRFFPDGVITRKRLRRAELAARVELEPLEWRYRNLDWHHAVGASGTIRAVDSVVRASGWSDAGITVGAMEELMEALARSGRFDRLELPGLSTERVPVFAGGVAILMAAFRALGINTMQAADGALREGLLYDLLGRIRHEDIRDRTVAAVASRYHVDGEQARRVESTVLRCVREVRDQWQLGRNAAVMLRWAAQLHEVGLDIAHSQHHKHGAYVLANADLPGFSRQEQQVLASLVRAHRRRFPRAVLESVPPPWRSEIHRLAILLRLAVVLHRSRSGVSLPEFSLVATPDSLMLTFPEAWLDDHPLTHMDLQQEANALRVAGCYLRFA